MIDVSYQQLLSEGLLHRAWRSVRAKGSAGGVDRVTIGAFNEKAAKELRRLKEQLTSGKYVPEPYLTVKRSKKKKGEYRQLGMLTVRDKIVQQAIHMLIYEPIDKLFLSTSYGYRRGKGPVKAIRRVLHCIRMEKRRWITELDFDDFFDNIPHDRLEAKLSELIADEQLRGLIMLCLKMGRVSNKLDWQEVTKGVPQGAILSPLLSNLYLHELDVFMEAGPVGYVRYADDFLLLSRSKEQAHVVLEKVKTYACKKLYLPLNPGSQVKPLREGIEFLGITFYEKTYGLSAQKLLGLKESLAKAIHFKTGKLSSKLEESTEGIRRYYGQLLTEDQLQPLDEFIKETLAIRIAENRSRFRSAKALRRALDPLYFLTTAYNDRRSLIIRELIGLGKVKPPKQVRITPDEALRRKRKEYEKLQSASMELLVSKPGVYLGISRQGITVREKGKHLLTAPTANVQHISVLSRGISISSNLISYCAENNIPIDFYDRRGKPYARIYTQDTTDGNIWQEQLQAQSDGRASVIATTIVCGKIRNQLNLLKYYFKSYRGGDEALIARYEHHAAEMNLLIRKVRKMPGKKEHDKLRGSLFAAEGRAGSLYWQLIRELIDDRYEFTGRERKGAADLVNSMLNYGYGILYGRLWDAALKARLNPYISYLHVYQPGKPTLTYDLIEEFRQPAVDRPVLALLNRKEKLAMESGRLHLDTRRKVAEKVLERLNSYVTFRRRRLRLSEIIRQQSKDFAAYLEGKMPSYKPYTFKW